VSVIVWPDDLPCSVTTDSLATGPRGSRLATAPDIGPAKLRRRGPKVAAATGILHVTQDQRARFDRFWEEDTTGGVLPFLFRDQQVDGYPLEDDLGAWLQTETGEPIRIESWWLCQFGQQDPAYTRLTGRRFRIQISLIILPS
jgi:hypothetical protein